MGRGDQRTRKGKIFRGTHGKTRPGKKKTTTTTARKATAKKSG
jgi:30S ribosomal protein S31